jgi:tetratricopeptide (TPR) repeat protein
MAGTDIPFNLLQAIRSTMAHFQAGRMSEAEAGLHRILAADSANHSALSDRRAPVSQADYAEAFKNLGVALAGLGKWDAALTTFRKALEINPDYADGHICVGNVYMAKGREEEAVACFQKALALNPDSAFAHNNLGTVMQRREKLEEARAYFEKALALNPGFADAHNNLGNVFHALGELNGALACYRKALECDPGHVDAHNNLGVVLQKLGKPEEALAYYRTALKLNPKHARSHNNMGTVFKMMGLPEQALACYHKALECNPNYVEALCNLGNVHQAQGRPEEALTCYHKALSLQPENAVALTNLAITRQSQGKLDEAVACYRRALQLKPGFANAQWNLAIALLLRGDFDEGLALYEKRFEGTDENNAALPERFSAKPRWQGKDLRGATLLVWSEQGLGDVILMLRYLPRLKEKGAGKIMVSCQPALIRLLQNEPAIDRVIGDRDPLPLAAIDYQCPVMSLPYLFGTRLETIPNTVPYINVPPAMTQKWARRLAATDGLKVGLAWAGSRTQKRDFLRSIPLQRLAPLLAVPGVRFVSLQKDEAVPDGALFDWMVECANFLDTAALAQQLDLIISVDTAVAHLAGALAKPVWLLNRFESEWRWMLDREDSPWYPTMRIFRQPAMHDWDSVIARVVEELKALVAKNA